MGAVAGADKTRINKEVAKLGHMLMAIKSAAIELIKRLRVGYKGDSQGQGKLPDAELNQVKSWFI